MQNHIIEQINTIEENQIKRFNFTPLVVYPSGENNGAWDSPNKIHCSLLDFSSDGRDVLYNTVTKQGSLAASKMHMNWGPTHLLHNCSQPVGSKPTQKI